MAPDSHVVAGALHVLLHVARPGHLPDVEELLGVLERGQARVLEITRIVLQVVDVVEDLHGE